MIDDVLSLAKSRAYSKVRSVQILVAVQSVSLAEAKLLVHNSRMWSDGKKQDDRLLDILRKIES